MFHQHNTIISHSNFMTAALSSYLTAIDALIHHAVHNIFNLYSVKHNRNPHVPTCYSLDI